jgi:hypothetical protein
MDGEQYPDIAVQCVTGGMYRVGVPVLLMTAAIIAATMPGVPNTVDRSVTLFLRPRDRDALDATQGLRVQQDVPVFPDSGKAALSHFRW